MQPSSHKNKLTKLPSQKHKPLTSHPNRPLERSLTTLPSKFSLNTSALHFQSQKPSSILSTSSRHVTFHPTGAPKEGETYKSIASKISSLPNLQHYQLINESSGHSGPPNRESHFKITIIAPFNQPPLNLKTLISRHRYINSLLSQELANGVHALSLHTFTPEEFQKRSESIPISPGCSSKAQNSAL